MKFFKYHGAGNDFILIDNRVKSEKNKLASERIAQLCDRHFGIGADGLILLEQDSVSDFKMVYYNSDGGESTMCGNGGRCIVAFARDLGLIKEKCFFTAIDGSHEARISGDWVELKMIDINGIEYWDSDYFINTGSPHHIKVLDSLTELKNLDVRSLGSEIRFGPRYKKSGGANVNFIAFEGDTIHIRTYERGVEGETLACGTGITAAALLAEHLGKSTGSNFSRIDTNGTQLEVSYELANTHSFKNVWLKGPAVKVFEGILPD